MQRDGTGMRLLLIHNHLSDCLPIASIKKAVSSTVLPYRLLDRMSAASSISGHTVTRMWPPRLLGGIPLSSAATVRVFFIYKIAPVAESPATTSSTSGTSSTTRRTRKVVDSTRVPVSRQQFDRTTALTFGVCLCRMTLSSAGILQSTQGCVGLTLALFLPSKGICSQPFLARARVS